MAYTLGLRFKNNIEFREKPRDTSLVEIPCSEFIILKPLK